jgi:Zn-dependent protease with chaperone function
MTTDSYFSSVLNLETLNLQKEKTYLIFVAIISVLFWLVVAISIIGLFYLGLIILFAWLANGLLIARLRSEAIRVSREQLPELRETFKGVCAKLGLARSPRLYVLESGGFLNAFATRFSGRNFVVIYSSMLDALGPSSHAMQFILGHEIGHIRSNHLLKKLLLAPGIFVPLIGPAYLRACEASCDRHGAFASDDLLGAVRAMLVLGGGGGHAAKLDPGAFARQHFDERGFFVSWHELISGYPTLSGRTSLLLALKDPVYDRKPSRNPFAYLFALFTSNMLVAIVIIGLLASMAIPAFNQVRLESRMKVRQNNEQQIAAAFDAYVQENGHSPHVISDFIGPGKPLEKMPVDPSGGTYNIDIQNGQPVVTCTLNGQSLDQPPSDSTPSN